MIALSAHAADPSFAELLAHAKAQAAAGHRWEPPGDNMTETIMRMMDMIPKATPGQLAELAALLDTNKPGSPDAAPNPTPPADQHAKLEAPPTKPEAPPLARSAPESATPTRPVILEEPPKVQVSPKSPAAPGGGEPIPDKTASGPGTRAALLFARGLDAERLGDLSVARRFYASAAEQGDATAALHLGRLYDPTYLKRVALGGVDPNPALARAWYERAVSLGDPAAGPLLEALSAR